MKLTTFEFFDVLFSKVTFLFFPLLSVLFGCCSGVINWESHVHLREIWNKFTSFSFRDFKIKKFQKKKKLDKFIPNIPCKHVITTAKTKV